MASAAHAANFDERPVRKPLVSRATINEKIRDTLHLYAGRGCRYSVAQLAEAAGVPERCIEAAKCEPHDPEHRPLPLEYLASICKFLGDPFASAFLEPAGLGAFELMDGQIPLPKVLSTAEAQPDVAEERRRLIRRLAELEGVQ
jgi:hypothetical protein